MAEITDAQQQERRKRAGDLLKMADKLFKGSDFEGAARLVNMAMEADPKNAYALAYQERIKYAIEQRDHQKLDAPPPGSAVPRPPLPGEPPRTGMPAIADIKKKLEEAQRKLQEQKAQPPTVTAPPKPAAPAAPAAAAPAQPSAPAAPSAPDPALIAELESARAALLELREQIEDEKHKQEALRRHASTELQERLQETRDQLTEQHRRQEEALREQRDAELARKNELQTRLQEATARWQAAEEQQRQTSAETIRGLQEEIARLQAARQEERAAAQEQRRLLEEDLAKRKEEDRGRLEGLLREQLETLNAERKKFEQELTAKFEQDLARGIDDERVRFEKLRQEQTTLASEEHRRVEAALRQQFEAEVVRRVGEERARLETLHQQSEAAAREDRRQLEEFLRHRVESELGGRVEEELSRLEEIRRQEQEDAERQRLELVDELRARFEAEGARRLEEERLKFEAEHRAALNAETESHRRREEEMERRFDEELAARLSEVQTTAAAARTQLQQELDARLAAEVHRLEEAHTVALAERVRDAEQALLRLRQELTAEFEKQRTESAAGHEAAVRKIDAEMQARLAAEAARFEALRREHEELRTQVEAQQQAHAEELAGHKEAALRILDEERARAAEDARRTLEEQVSAEREIVREQILRQVSEDVDAAVSREREQLQKEREQLELELRRLDDVKRDAIQQDAASRQELEDRLTARFEDDRKKLEADLQTAHAEAFLALQEDANRRMTELETYLRSETDARIAEERRRFEERRTREQQAEAEERRRLQEETERRMTEQFNERLTEERQRWEQEFVQSLESERVRIETDLRGLYEEQERAHLAERERAEAELRTKQREAEQQRQLAEAEALRRKNEEDARKYEEAVRTAIEDGRRQAQAKKIRSYVDQAKQYLAGARFEEAMSEVSRVFRLEPDNAAARELEQTIYAARLEHQRRRDEFTRLQDDHRRQLEGLQARLKDQAREDEELDRQRGRLERHIADAIQRATDSYRGGDNSRALSEIEAVYAMSPGNPAARELENAILSMEKSRQDVQTVMQRRIQQNEQYQRDQARRERTALDQRDQLKRESMQMFHAMVKRAWTDGPPTRDARIMLDVARSSLGLDEADCANAEGQAQIEAYRDAIGLALSTGRVTRDDAAALDEIRERYQVRPSDQEEVLRSLPSSQA